jgi:hypothetical protein
VLDAAPTVTTPTISGNAQEGQTLSASASSGQSDNPVTYAWYSSVDGYTNAIGTGATYLVKEGDEGFTIEAKATATNGNGVAVAATSAATSTVLDAPPTVTTPTITGTAQEGQTLGAAASSGQSDNPVTYAWYSSVDGYTNAIGTGATYLVKEGDEGFTIEAKATATNGNGATVTATSAATSAVLDAPPTVTAPTISGNAQEGQTLTAAASSGQSDNPVTYAWYSSADGYASSIGSGSTYLVKEGDEGFTIEAKATATNGNGVTVTATSAATSTVLDAAPTVTTPTITGNAQEGQTLTASASSGQSDNGVTYAWYSSADGYTTSLGTGSTYLVKEGDEGFTIEVKATATNDNGVTITKTSAPTAAVSDITLSFTSAAAISGSAQEGQVLTAVAGMLNDSDAAVTGWQWTRDGVNLSGATASTYTVIEADEGHVLRVVETATDADGGPATTSTSAPTSAVSDITLSFTSAAAISGSAQEGHVLTAVAGTLNDPDASITSYQWTRDGVIVSTSAFPSTYTVTEADEGHVLALVETAIDADGGPTTTSTSAPTATVVDVFPAPAKPTVSGNTVEGQTLTASSVTTGSDEALNIAYQWQSASTVSGTYTNISGATASTYTLQETDENKFIQVAETFTDDTGQSTTLTSTPIGMVVDFIPTPATPTVSGNAIEGQTLTASSVTTGSDEALSIAYQWQSATSANGTYTNITGATASTYVLQETDENRFIRVAETFTDDTGLTVTRTSAATSKVVDVPPTMAVPTIADSTNAGAFREGDVLTALTTVTTDDGGVGVNGNSAISYQWQRSANGSSGWSNIGSNSASYTLTVNDENNYLQVITSFTDDTGQTVTQTSAVTPQVAPLVLNGGFEQGNLNDWTFSGNTQATAVNSGSFSGISPHSGTYEFHMGPVGSDGFRDQNVPTVVGNTYRIDFFLANAGGTPSDFTAAFGGTTLLHLVNTAAQGWTEYTFNEVATSLSTDLHFAFRQDPSYWFLDDISVTDPVATETAPTIQIGSEPTVFDNSGSLALADGSCMVLTGIINNTGTIALSAEMAATSLVISGDAVFAGGGTIQLSDSSMNTISGDGSDCIFSNIDNLVIGSGHIGGDSLSVINKAGLIEATGSNPLIIDTGSNAIINTGTLESNAGSLILRSDVEGAGNATIVGGSIEFQGSSDANVSFDSGSGGMLQLDKPESFTGTVAGFGGQDQIDLGNIAYSDVTTTLDYWMNSDSSGGTLTVSDGTHTANLSLLGQYAASSFAMASDGHGGTLIAEAAAIAQTQPLQPHA